MLVYQKARSDNARLGFLKMAIITAIQDIEKDNRLISGKNIDKMQSLTPAFEEQQLTVKEKANNRAKEIREKDDAIETLKIYVRDMWEVVKRRTVREKNPAEILIFYQLPKNGIIPKYTMDSQWLSVAMRLIEGDKNAIDTGYKAIQNPSATELNTVLVKAQKEYSNVATADREYDISQENLAKTRIEVDDLIKDIIAELRFYLRKNDPSSQRRIMRSYGAVFKSVMNKK